jgi:hypothetical protein
LRLKSEIWVQAFLRRCMTQGLYGAVLTRGATEAGAVFVVINHLDKTYDLLGPPPGATFNEGGDRQFTRETVAAVPEPDINTILARRKKFDPDLWVVEIEDRNGMAGLTSISE